MQSDEHIERTPEERRELALSLAQVVNSWHRGEPEESAEPAAPIHLNDKQLEIIKEWAADDRLWTTPETVEFNLEVFARAIIAAIPKRTAPSPDQTLQTLLQLRDDVEVFIQHDGAAGSIDYDAARIFHARAAMLKTIEKLRAAPSPDPPAEK